MDEKVAELFLRVVDAEADALARMSAGVADLAAGFAIKRRLIEDDEAGFAGRRRLTSRRRP